MVKHARTAAQIRGMMDETERCVILSAFAILGLSFCVGFKAQPPRSNRDHLAFQNFKILKCSMRTQAIDLYGRFFITIIAGSLYVGTPALLRG